MKKRYGKEFRSAYPAALPRRLPVAVFLSYPLAACHVLLNSVF